jgi:hypothetical protein
MEPDTSVTKLVAGATIPCPPETVKAGGSSEFNDTCVKWRKNPPTFSPPRYFGPCRPHQLLGREVLSGNAKLRWSYLSIESTSITKILFVSGAARISSNPARAAEEPFPSSRSKQPNKLTSAEIAVLWLNFNGSALP